MLSGRRALRAVELLARAPEGLAFSRLERALEISSASLARLLRMLVAEGWTQTNAAGHYIVGPKLMVLSRHLARHWSDHELLEPIVVDLARATGHSACFARFANDGFVLTAKREMPSSFHFIDLFWVNHDLLPNGIVNGMALCLLAHADGEVVARLLRTASPAQQALAAEKMAEFRARGSLVSPEEHVLRVIAPVHGGQEGGISGVIAIAALNPDRVLIEECVEQVRRAAKVAERRLASAAAEIDGEIERRAI